jgi:hypothetical protein
MLGTLIIRIQDEKLLSQIENEKEPVDCLMSFESATRCIHTITAQSGCVNYCKLCAKYQRPESGKTHCNLGELANHLLRDIGPGMCLTLDLR